MRKKKIIFGIICLFTILTLTGCGDKTATTPETFIAAAKNNYYITKDITNQYTSYDYIDQVIIAKSPKGYQIEFYVLSDANYATSMFNANKNTFESFKSNASSSSSVSMGNYSKYSLTSNGYYMYISRIDNTIIYVKEKSNHKDDIKDFIKELGY